MRYAILSFDLYFLSSIITLFFIFVHMNFDFTIFYTKKIINIKYISQDEKILLQKLEILCIIKVIEKNRVILVFDLYFVQKSG